VGTNRCGDGLRGDHPLGLSKMQGLRCLPANSQRWPKNGNIGLTICLLSRPEPLPTSSAATRGVTKRAKAISLVMEVYILKVKVK